MNRLIVGNWKMNPQTAREAEQLFDGVQGNLPELKEAEVVVAPPFIYLQKLADTRDADSLVQLGAQDAFWEEKGAYTGEVSMGQLHDLGCTYVILGHSERREHLLETYEQVALKAKAAVETGLTPIICVGESKEDRDHGNVEKVLGSQVVTAFSRLTEEDVARAALAYEPIWAIGTGDAADAAIVHHVQSFLRETVAAKAGLQGVHNLRILYGGSVKSGAAAVYMTDGGMNGLLIGGASLDAAAFTQIVQETAT